MSISPTKSQYSSGVVLLYKISSANMQSTSDQVLTQVEPFAEAVITMVVAAPVSGNSTGCTGGVYNGTSKSGNAMVSVGTAWGSLSASAPKLPMIYQSFNNTQGASIGKFIATGDLYLSLSTGANSACTADLYFYGVVLN